MLIDFERIIDFTEDGKLTLRASEYLRVLVRQVNINETLTGVGSPEGVIEAIPTQRYADSNGTTGNILYIKKTGTGATGWILV